MDILRITTTDYDNINLKEDLVDRVLFNMESGGANNMIVSTPFYSNSNCIKIVIDFTYNEKLDVTAYALYDNDLDVDTFIKTYLVTTAKFEKFYNFCNLAYNHGNKIQQLRLYCYLHLLVNDDNNRKNKLRKDIIKKTLKGEYREIKDIQNITLFTEKICIKYGNDFIEMNPFPLVYTYECNIFKLCPIINFGFNKKDFNKKRKQIRFTNGRYENGININEYDENHKLLEELVIVYYFKNFYLNVEEIKYKIDKITHECIPTLVFKKSDYEIEKKLDCVGDLINKCITIGTLVEFQDRGMMANDYVCLMHTKRYHHNPYDIYKIINNKKQIIKLLQLNDIGSKFKFSNNFEHVYLIK